MQVADGIPFWDKVTPPTLRHDDKMDMSWPDAPGALPH